MSFFGCENWPGFRAALDVGVDLPEPANLLFAEIADDGERRTACAAWREGDVFTWLSFFWHGGMGTGTRAECLRLENLDRSGLVERLMRHCADRVLHDLGLGRRILLNEAPGLSDLQLRHARAVAAEAGEEIGWKVTCTTGEWDDIYTATVAVYRDPALAAAHARAAGLAEEDRIPAEDDHDDAGSWGADWVLLRESLPSVLIPYARGEKVPPVRPARFKNENHDRVVTVPARGEVTFEGFGCERVSAAFLMALPLAKPRRDDRYAADGSSRLHEVRAEGEGAISYGFDDDQDADGMRGVARATGPDAEALLALVVPAVEASACRHRRYDTEDEAMADETDADEVD